MGEKGNHKFFCGAPKTNHQKILNHINLVDCPQGVA